MKRKPIICCLGLLLLSALSISACGGNAGGSKAATVAAAPAEAYEMEYAAAQETAASGDSYSRVAGSGGLTDTTSAVQSVSSNRKLIRTVNMSVETDSFDPLLRTLTGQVEELGGYVEQSDISGNSINYQNEPIPRYASLTVRIPVDKLDGFITTVENNGNVTNKSEGARDVTLQYSDLESRKKSLTVEQDRIWALLEKADTLESVIVLEERLSEIRYELESMESQLRLYDNQVDYSTVNLYINEIKGAQTFTPTAPETFGQRIQSGFTRNFNAMTQWLTGFIIWIITCSPFWLPLAVIILAVILVGRRVGRRRAKQEYKDDYEKADGMIKGDGENEEEKDERDTDKRNV